jgi:hypothetical protein
MVARLMQLFGLGGYTCYGDSIYTASEAIVRAIRGVMLVDVVKRQNQSLNMLRVEVEHAFGKMKGLWQAVHFKPKQKVLDSPVGVGRVWKVAFFLTNCHTCLRGSQMSAKFGCSPPHLATYVKGGVAPGV